MSDISGMGLQIPKNLTTLTDNQIQSIATDGAAKTPFTKEEIVDALTYARNNNLPATDKNYASLVLSSNKHPPQLQPKKTAELVKALGQELRATATPGKAEISVANSFLSPNSVAQLTAILNYVFSVMQEAKKEEGVMGADMSLKEAEMGIDKANLSKKELEIQAKQEMINGVSSAVGGAAGIGASGLGGGLMGQSISQTSGGIGGSAAAGIKAAEGAENKKELGLTETGMSSLRDAKETSKEAKQSMNDAMSNLASNLQQASTKILSNSGIAPAA